MTVGDTICLKYNNKNYMLDVREVKPAPAACIIETDCEVDFESPADYVSPVPAAAKAAAPAVPSDVPYGGKALLCAAFTPTFLNKTDPVCARRSNNERRRH